MGHAAAALLVIAQPLGALTVVLLPPLVMSRRGPSRTSAALWALALVLLATWAVSTYRAGAGADESGDVRLLLGTAHWLGLAVGAALASVLVTRRARARA